jgi:ferric-dicitrate binding protein FerR (iron transport regulator)
MKPSPELERLFNDLADGLLSDDAEAQLATVLRSDAAARRRYRQFMALHAGLMWDYAAAAMPAEENAGAQTQRARRSWWRSVTAIAAAVVLIGALAALWLPRRAGHSAIVAQLSSATGAVSWSDGSSGQRAGLAAGVELAAGTLFVESETGSAQLRFRDGTVVTLAGEAELGFSDAGQKRLTLRRGALTAKVQRQPANRPLVIRTATAEVEVLGTEFSLSADRATTGLSVENGSVRMRRLTDGQSVEVGGKQSAVASLDGKGALRAESPAAPPSAWREVFDAAPPELSRGEWLPAAEALPARALAAPYVATRSKEGVPVIHYGVGLRSDPRATAGFVTLSSGSVVKARVRVTQRTHLKLFLSCYRGGTFGGNFELLLSKTEVDANGWLTLEAPLREAAPVMNYPEIEGTSAFQLILHSIQTDAGLEVAELAINPG